MTGGRLFLAPRMPAALSYQRQPHAPLQLRKLVDAWKPPGCHEGETRRTPGLTACSVRVAGCIRLWPLRVSDAATAGSADPRVCDFALRRASRAAASASGAAQPRGASACAAALPPPSHELQLARSTFCASSAQQKPLLTGSAAAALDSPSTPCEPCSGRADGERHVRRAHTVAAALQVPLPTPASRSRLAAEGAS
jgi:hypothetical protein